MFSTGRISWCFGVFLLVLIVLGFGVDASADEPLTDQKPTSTPTTKLLALLETLKPTDTPDLKKIRQLLDAGADIEATEKEYGRTLLRIASFQGHVEVVKLLLAAKANVEAGDKEFASTSLAVASQNGHLEIVKLLLAAKANVNAAAKYGITALFMASKNGHIEIVKLLLDAKANVDATNKNFHATPLLLASQWPASYVDIGFGVNE